MIAFSPRTLNRALMSYVISIATMALILNSAYAESTKSIDAAKDVQSEFTVLILGDSLTEGYGVSKTAAFPNQLQVLLNQKFAKQKTKVINAGSSGSTSASALSRLKWHLRSKPNVLLLALGANDGLRGFSVSATKKNLQKTIALAKENKIKVILAGMKLPLNYGEKYRNDFESTFKDLAKSEKIEFIPFLLKDVGGQPQLNLPDGIHPNEKGHKIIAENLVPYMEKYY